MIWLVPFSAKGSDKEVVSYDGKKIAISSIGNGIFSDEKNITKALSSGIYIRAIEMGGEPLVQAENIIKECFVANGLKIADQLDNAEIAIVFLASGSITMDSANKAKEASILPNSQKIIANTGAFAITAINGGTAAVAFLAAGLGVPENMELIGAIHTKPVFFKPWIGNEAIKSSLT